MLTSTFNLQFKEIMALIEELDLDGIKTPLEVAMAMGKVGIACDHDTSFEIYGFNIPPKPRPRPRRVPPPPSPFIPFTTALGSLSADSIAHSIWRNTKHPGYTASKVRSC
ncbi:hypothetical protein NMY22_g18380 [Coprinellus aureogranulatus]|nr:hypothetical protein NMY22_g18380 [Coprinellus aureogranulatus]